ncbi:MAG: glutamate racemase [Parachlamydiales bacterium]|nr:glutamate racemase [Parachlamydiales bacterium]
MNFKRDLGIGIFDSGFGGLTVMRQVMDLLPNENIYYLGDTARLPYGNKSPDTILRYSIENAIFLLDKNIKALVVACNTATAYSLDRLQQIFNIPIIGVIEPGAEEAAKISTNGNIAVLGTRGTIDSQVYHQALLKLIPNVNYHGQICPLLVHLVEENMVDHPITNMALNEYLQFLKHSTIDTIVLGCTHFPLLQNAIQQIAGDKIQLVNSANACANKLKSVLEENKLLTLRTILGTQKYFISDDIKKFSHLGKAFLGLPIKNIEHFGNHF